MNARNVIIGLLAATTLSAPLAWAADKHVIGAHSGFGWPNEDRDCFQASWARMVNYCPTYKLLVIPMEKLVTYFSAWAYAGGNGKDGGYQSTYCQAIGVDSNNYAWVNNWAFTTGTSESQRLRLERVTTSGEGTWHVECLVAPNGGFVQSIGWP